MSAVLLACLSQKPAPSESDKKSATRQLIKLCAESLDDKYVSYDFFDIRETPFPFFDGGQPRECGKTVSDMIDRIIQAEYLIFSLPAYWGSISGVAKNFFDVIAGSAYDQSTPCQILKGKHIGAIVVGGNKGDSASAVSQLNELVRSLGSPGLSVVVRLDNPRTHKNMQTIVRKCYQLPFTLAIKATGKGRGEEQG